MTIKENTDRISQETIATVRINTKSLICYEVTISAIKRKRKTNNRRKTKEIKWQYIQEHNLYLPDYARKQDNVSELQMKNP